MYHREGSNVIQLGVEYGEFGAPDDSPEEVKAIEKVMGGVEEGLDQLVTAAREACPNPNCCLTVAAYEDEAQGGHWDEHPMNDTTYTVPFTRIEVGSKRMIDCVKRADQLTDAVVSMGQTCIEATREAKAAGKEKTDAAGEKAQSATNTPTVKEAQETIAKAQKKIDAAEARAEKIRAGGKAKAKQARDAVYARTREAMTASFSETVS